MTYRQELDKLRLAAARPWTRTSGTAGRLLGYAIAAAGLGLTWQLFSAIFLAYGLIGTDGVTYLAAAERLDAGNGLYAIAPGDRLVYGLGSPCCRYPLMSPPPIAVLWRPLALLGPTTALLLWDWVNAVAIIGTVGLLLVRLPLATGVLVVLLALPLAMETLLGNINGLLLAGIAATWLLGKSGRYAYAGAVIGVMAAVKLWPALLIVWFVSQGHLGTLKGFVASTLVVGSLSLLGAGITAHLDYLTTVVPAAVSQATLAGMVQAATGLWMPWLASAVLLAGMMEVWALRSRPRVAWAATVLTMVFASPAFHIGTLVVLFGALVPWAEGSPGPIQSVDSNVSPWTPLDNDLQSAREDTVRGVVGTKN